ncbi:MAG: putative cadaverine/lysine antiporter [Candidatus Anoxychlamydiales bacterium]|nr:putative cadaverine/lysine antiporter [Candidatus Anoxychlamydiales bacterium]
MAILEKKKIGLIGAIAIVAGNMMGSGIALLPSSLASIGSITIISWTISLFGVLSLAFVFARLGLKDPKQGGPVAYARKLSPILGFQTELLYWGANWIGNLAIAITGVEYLSVFYHPLTDPIIGGIATIIFLWIFTIINFFGADKIAKIVSVTVLLLLIPVIGTAVFGWFHFSSEIFISNWNVSSMSSSRAIFSGILLAIWAFIGVESASVSANLVENPKRTIPLATLIGTGIAALAYIASTTAISGMFPANEMVKSGAPFAVSFAAITGNWIKPFVSAFTAVACLASLGSWMMLVGQAGIAAAKRGTLPPIFGRINEKRGVPIAGLIINSILMSILMILIMIISYLGKKNTIEVFNFIISIAVLLTLFPYLYSCLQLIKLDGIRTKLFISFISAILACILIFIALAGAEKQEMVGALIVSLICFILYAIKQSKKSKEIN